MYYYQTIFVVLNIVLPILAATAVGLRFKARQIQQLQIKGDDLTILAALIITVANAIGCIYAVYVENYGDLIIMVTPEQTPGYFKYLYASSTLVAVVFGLVKISVLLFYRRIFITTTFQTVVNVCLVVCVAWTIAGTVAAIFRTTPISDYWNHEAQTSFDWGTYNIAMAVLDIFLDLVILSLPLPAIRSLQISTKKKVSLIGIFWLGLFCVVSSAIRLYYGKYLTDVADSPGYVMMFPEAATYTANSASLWAMIECDMSIIAACLPTLVPMAAKFATFRTVIRSWSRLISSRKTSRTDGSGISSNNWPGGHATPRRIDGETESERNMVEHEMEIKHSIVVDNSITISRV